MEIGDHPVQGSEAGFAAYISPLQGILEHDDHFRAFLTR